MQRDASATEAMIDQYKQLHSFGASKEPFIEIDPYAYDGPYRASHCKLRIWRRGGPIVVIMATERPDNPGMSITNTAKRLATNVIRSLGIDPTLTTWIEHYREGIGSTPGRLHEADWESFDRIDFDWDYDSRSLPFAALPGFQSRWHRMSYRDVEALTGLRIE